MIFEIVGFAATLLQKGIFAPSLLFWTTPKPPSEESGGLMINLKVVRNIVVNKSDYDFFPLAAIFGTPHISPPKILGGDI